MTTPRRFRWVLFGCAVVALGLFSLCSCGVAYELLGQALPRNGELSIFLAYLAATVSIAGVSLFGFVALLRRTQLGRWVGLSALLALYLGNAAKLTMELLPERTLISTFEAGIALLLGLSAVVIAGGRSLLEWNDRQESAGLLQPGFARSALRRAVLIHFAIAPIILTAALPLSNAHAHGMGNRGCMYYEGHAPFFIAAGSIIAALLLLRGRTAGLFLMALVDLAFGGFMAWMWGFMAHSMFHLVALAAGGTATTIALAAVSRPAWRALASRQSQNRSSHDETNLVDLHLGNVSLLLLLPLVGAVGAGALGSPYWGSEAGEVEFLHLTLLAAPFAAGLISARSYRAAVQLELRGKLRRRHLLLTAGTMGLLLSALWLVASGFSRPVLSGLPSVLVNALIPISLLAVVLAVALHRLLPRRPRLRRCIGIAAAVLLLIAMGLIRAPHYLSLASGPRSLLTGTVYAEPENANAYRERWATEAPIGLPAIEICDRNMAYDPPMCEVLGAEIRELGLSILTTPADLRHRLSEGRYTEPMASLAAEEVARQLVFQDDPRDGFARMERLIAEGPPERARRRHAWLMQECRVYREPERAARHARRVIELGDEHDRWSAEASEMLSHDAEARGDLWAAFWHQTRARSHYMFIVYEERPADRLVRLLWEAAL